MDDIINVIDMIIESGVLDITMNEIITRFYNYDHIFDAFARF